MKPGAGRKKGQQFERDICRILSKWVIGVDDPVIFWRSPGSGGRSTGARSRGHVVSQGGDIVTADPRGAPFLDYWSAELKFHKQFDLIDLLNGRGDLFDSWMQCRRDAVETAKAPLLIFRRNALAFEKGKTWCLFRYHVANLLVESPPTFFAMAMHVPADNPLHETCLCSLDDYMALPEMKRIAHVQEPSDSTLPEPQTKLVRLRPRR